MEEMLKIFSALGNDTRFRIVKMLENRELCVCEIKDIIGSSMSTISNHLKILKESKVIFSEKEDKFVFYFLNRKNKTMVEILKILDKIDDGIILEDKKKVNNRVKFEACSSLI